MREKSKKLSLQKGRKSPSERREKQTAYTEKSKMQEDRTSEGKTEFYRKWGYIYFLSSQVASQTIQI